MTTPTLFSLILAITAMTSIFVPVYATTSQAEEDDVEEEDTQSLPPGLSSGTPDTAYDFMGEADDETKEMFVELAIEQIRNMTNPSISVSEDGNLYISQYDPQARTSISVGVQHPFTNENGYEVDNGQLVAPNGTEIFP